MLVTKFKMRVLTLLLVTQPRHFLPAFLYLMFPAYCNSNLVGVILWLRITFLQIIWQDLLIDRVNAANGIVNMAAELMRKIKMEFSEVKRDSLL